MDWKRSWSAVRHNSRRRKRPESKPACRPDRERSYGRVGRRTRFSLRRLHAPRAPPTKLNASPTFWLRRLRPVSWELCTLRDVWALAAGAAGNDGACRGGISQVGVKTGRETFPPMSWAQRYRPWSCRNTGNSSGLFVACCPCSGPISSVQVVGCRSRCPWRPR